MTFLEYLARRLMGPPVSGSCWHCPYCESSGPSFSVRPPKGDKPIKFKCHRCQRWGDEFDLLQCFFPETLPGQPNAYQKRLNLIQTFRSEYDLGMEPKSLAAAVSSLRGQGNDNSDNSQAFALVWANLQETFQRAGIDGELVWKLVETVALQAEEHGISVQALLGYHHEFRRWIRDGEAQHMQECDDPECDYACCRKARGWTQEEIGQDIEREKQQQRIAKRERRERIHRAMNRNGQN